MAAAGSNGHEPAANSTCGKHDAAISQLQDDMRLFTQAQRDQEGRMDKYDNDVGAILKEIGMTRISADKAAEKAMLAVDASITASTSVNKLADSMIKLSSRVTDLEIKAGPSVPPRPSLLSLSDDDFSEDTKTNIQLADKDGLLALFIQERTARAAAEARVSERNRQSDRAKADNKEIKAYRLEWWKLLLGAIGGIGTGSVGLALLQHFLKVAP